MASERRGESAEVTRTMSRDWCRKSPSSAKFGGFFEYELTRYRVGEIPEIWNSLVLPGQESVSDSSGWFFWFSITGVNFTSFQCPNSIPILPGSPVLQTPNPNSMGFGARSRRRTPALTRSYDELLFGGRWEQLESGLVWEMVLFCHCTLSMDSDLPQLYRATWDRSCAAVNIRVAKWGDLPRAPPLLWGRLVYSHRLCEKHRVRGDGG